MNQTSRNKTLNEEETIDLIWRVLQHKRTKKRHLLLDPFSDDVSWVNNKKNVPLIVAKADMLVTSTDAPRQMTATQIGSKAITSAVSDFAAKGIRPKFCVISLAIPKQQATRAFIRSLARGLEVTSRRYGVKIIAGDTNSSKAGLIIDVPLFGFAKKIVKRSGAREGDLVAVSGWFGLQAAGLLMLLGNGKSVDPNFAKRAQETVLEPKAKLSLGLAISKYLTSSIDSSDGLALSLYYLAEASGVDIVLDSLPIAPGVREFAVANHRKAEDLALFGGEEYELVVTFSPKFESVLRHYGLIVIGKVVPRRKESNPSIYLQTTRIPRRGWIHNQ